MAIKWNSKKYSTHLAKNLGFKSGIEWQKTEEEFKKKHGWL